MGYKEIYERSLTDPEGFWLEQAEAIDWTRKPTKALFDDNAPLYEWYSDGLVNTCWNALDRHVEAGRGAQAAIIHDSPVTGTKHRISYAQLRSRVARLAGALRARGVEKGDRVIIYMPMVPEALEAMLACARIGAVHSVVFGGFAAHELAVRIDDCAPKAIIAASCGIEPGRVVSYKPLLDGAIEQAAHKPEFCVIFQREEEVAHLEPGRDVDWHACQYGVEPAECLPVEGNHPAYILYTSGTTGAPNRRAPRGAQLDYEKHLQRKPRRGVLGRLGRGLGRGPQLYLLRAPDPRQHHRGVRGQAGGHARRGHVLAGDFRA